MSSRTRQNRLRKPGVAGVNRPARLDRRAEHRRVRRAAHVELRQLEEPEDHALTRPVNTSEKVDPSERMHTAASEGWGDETRRKFKVWKTKSWKRRSLQRAERAASYQKLLKSV